eukprot:GHRR01037422.1.p1 GENE.GHRR01037422.1~~GHRR01037422.1.p1  ORF type:complete len:125 (+),score=20.12 GHRR01037422.1:260-634(+)
MSCLATMWVTVEDHNRQASKHQHPKECVLAVAGMYHAGYCCPVLPPAGCCTADHDMVSANFAPVEHGVEGGHLIYTDLSHLKYLHVICSMCQLLSLSARGPKGFCTDNSFGVCTEDDYMQLEHL